jgi:hypothetical protein
VILTLLGPEHYNNIFKVSYQQIALQRTLKGRTERFLKFLKIRKKKQQNGGQIKIANFIVFCVPDQM